MSLAPKTCTCPCGNVLDIPVIDGFSGEEYDVCNVECPKCYRRASGGNYRTGVVNSWMTARQIYESELEYERQSFEADMNEFYGRGEW